MQGFCRLTSVIIALTGFAITGGLLLSMGESLPFIIIKAVAVFAVLFVVQNFLGGMLISVTGTNSQSATNKQAGHDHPKPGEGG